MSANCRCLSITSATVTTTLTPAAITITATAIAQLTTLITATKDVTNTVTTIVTTTTTTVVRETAAAVCSAPAPPSLANNFIDTPRFDRNFASWVTGGQGGSFDNSVVGSPECGYSAVSEVTGAGGTARNGQYLPGVDETKTYRFTLSAKKLSGPGSAGCAFTMTCSSIPSDDESKIRTLSLDPEDIPQTWKIYSLDCPPGASNIEVVYKTQCLSGGAPVAIGVDEISLVAISTTSTTPNPQAPAPLCPATLPASNLLTNPSFDDGTIGPWVGYGTNGGRADSGNDAECGSGAHVSVKQSSSSTSMQRTATCLSAGIYRFSIYAKKVDGDGETCNLRVTCTGNGDSQILPPVAGLSGWTQFSVDCPRIPASANQGARPSGVLDLSVVLSCSSSGAPVTIGVDAVSLTLIS